MCRNRGPAIPDNKLRRYGALFALILAGEVIFSLPFHIPRFFRPTLLEVFQPSNTQLDDIFAAYGVVALLANFPVAAIAAGLWADRWRSSKVVSVSFFCAGAAFFWLSRDGASALAETLLLANILITFFAVYALRGIYFSLIEEAGLDRRITGSAVGLISVLGFTPDVFFAALTGRILDANPGASGFGHYFLLIALISAAGMVFALLLSKQRAR